MFSSDDAGTDRGDVRGTEQHNRRTWHQMDSGDERKSSGGALHEGRPTPGGVVAF